MIPGKNKIMKKTTIYLIILALLLFLIPASIILGSSEKDLKETYERTLLELETAKKEVSEAESSLESVKSVVAEKGTILEETKQKLSAVEENYKSALPEVEKLEEKLIFARASAEEADSFYNEIKESGNEESISGAEETVKKANAELESVSAKYDEANSNLRSLEKELDEAKAIFKEAKAAADDANASLQYAEKVLNEKNDNLKRAQEEVEKARAELEEYQAKLAEEEKADDEVTEENKTEDNGDLLEEELTSEDEATPAEESLQEEEKADDEVTEENKTEDNGDLLEEDNPIDALINVEGTTEDTQDGNLKEEATLEEESTGEDEISDEEIPEEELTSEDKATTAEESLQEEEETSEEEVINLTSELAAEEPVAGETEEAKIDIIFSIDENGYIPVGKVTAFSASIEGINAFQYFWDFGDGTSSISMNPQHTYAIDGNYTLSLIILDSGGNAYSKSVTVHVSDYNSHTTEYWISVDATGGGAGTIDSPFTIDEALAYTVNGDILYFLPGTYFTSVSLDNIGTGTKGVSIDTEAKVEVSDETANKEENIPEETEAKEDSLSEDTEDETTAEDTTEELSIKFIAYDNVVFDGRSTLDSAFYFSSPLSYLGFYNFTFINYLGSAIYINNEDATNISIIDNTFSGNGAAIDVTIGSSLDIQNNIIVDNNKGVVISSDDINIEHNIIAFNEEGIIIDDTRDNIKVDYNDIYGNEKDYQGVEPGENDISIDPEFADKDNLDFTIIEDSPLYENNIIWKTKTDKDDYRYGEQVIITGKGYSPYQELIIRILRADGTFVDDIYITADADGNFIYDRYSVDYAGKDYLVQIIGADGNTLEVLGFTDCHPTIKLIKSGFPTGGLPSGQYAGFTLYKS
ncbi:MAG: PKD domain-containing protein, partial [Nitrospira sp.]|nr:PKD domain-containing protein [Nitrospira sp.]